MTSSSPRSADSRVALIVQQAGKPQQVLSRYLALLLNYRYGLDIMVVHNLVEAFSAMQRNPDHIVCAFVIQNRPIENRSAVAPLHDDGSNPLFLVLPAALIPAHRDLCQRIPNVHFCAWENAFSHTGIPLHKVISAAFARHSIGDLPVETAAMRPKAAAEHIQQRLDKVTTLPTLPELVLRIIRMVEDPQTTMEELEQVLLQDPSVVHKLLQVVRAAPIAGSTGREIWTLQETIVRLGRRQVGAIALQIKLMNSLVRPEESAFDLHRFWRHSVACAMIADRLCTDGRLPLPEPIPFSTCWTACLLHDIGKLVLGFFFWSHFQDLLEKTRTEGISFREAELELGDQVNHEFLGKVLLERSHLDPAVVEAVARHHSADHTDPPLVWVVHLANNLAQELDLGCAEGTVIRYRPPVLRALHLDEEEARSLAAELAPAITDRVKQVVQLCLGHE